MQNESVREPADVDYSSQAEPDERRLLLECRPQTVYAAIYDQLPFPNIGPVQQLAFDLGVTAVEHDYTLLGLVIRVGSGHQLLMEQRWPERVLRLKSGLDDLSIPKGTGIALRAVHLQIHGFEPVTWLDLTVVARRRDSEETRQALLRVPVEHPELRTDLHFPLAGTWWAIQASDWTDMHKGEVVSQPFALDFVKLGPESSFFRGGGAKLEEHFSWSQPVYAAAGGKVAYAAHDMPDNEPGSAPDPLIFRNDPRRLLGNAVAISHGNGEFSYYAHLQQASLQVRYGEVVRRGALLGQVGNSGQSPGPNLHFHLMNGPNLLLDQGLPLRLSHFSAGGQYFSEPISIPTRMIVTGPARGVSINNHAAADEKSS